MSLLPTYDDPRDAMNAWMRHAAAPMAAVLILLVIVIQQVRVAVESDRLAKPPPAIAEREEITEPGIAPLTLQSKYVVRWAFSELPGKDRLTHTEAREQLHHLDRLAPTRTDRVRVALVAGELLDKQEAIARLDKVLEETSAGSDLAADIATLKRGYQQGFATLTEEQRGALIARHGWFAELAFSFGTPPTDGFRTSNARAYESLVSAGVFGASKGCLELAVLVFSFFSVASMIYTQQISRRLSEPVLPAWFHGEAFVAAMIGLLIALTVRFGSVWLNGTAAVVGWCVAEVLEWAAIGFLAWPLLRGVPWDELARDWGLTRETSVRREALVALLGVGISMLASFAIGLVFHLFTPRETDGTPAPFQTHDLPLSNSWVPVVLGTLDAVVWAPVYEEATMRGALFSALLPRLKAPGAILVSALVFGALHAYGARGILDVTCTGLVLGMLRWWRGCLLAPVLMHLMHNLMISWDEIMFLRALDR